MPMNPLTPTREAPCGHGFSGCGLLNAAAEPLTELVDAP